MAGPRNVRTRTRPSSRSGPRTSPRPAWPTARPSPRRSTRSRRTPRSFAGRETNSNEVVEAAPAALEDAWAALESRDQARDRFNDDATDAERRAADASRKLMRTRTCGTRRRRRRTSPATSRASSARPSSGRTRRTRRRTAARRRRANADGGKQLEGVDSPAARAARRASVAGLSGLSDAWRWVDELDDELKEKALDAKRAALGAVPDVAAAWAAVEACGRTRSCGGRPRN